MKAIVALTLTFVMLFFSGCKPEEQPDDGGYGTYNGHDYVDLGLPSGTLWATSNVGANATEDFGDYFSWGETFTKPEYSWSTYKYCDGDDHHLTKYCNEAAYGLGGFTDDLTVLQPADDAATVYWGDGWCMPTEEQWRELREYTNSAWVTQNGVKGRLFTALDDSSSLFLPAAGYYWEGEPYVLGTGGGYWSSSLRTDYAYDAQSFGFNAEDYNVNGRFRVSGYTVRPVVVLGAMD